MCNSYLVSDIRLWCCPIRRSHKIPGLYCVGDQLRLVDHICHYFLRIVQICYVPAVNCGHLKVERIQSIIPKCSNKCDWSATYTTSDKLKTVRVNWDVNSASEANDFLRQAGGSICMGLALTFIRRFYESQHKYKKMTATKFQDETQRSLKSILSYSAAQCQMCVKSTRH